MENTEVAEIAALVGALGAGLVLVPRHWLPPIVGLALLGLGTAALAWSLVGTDEIDRLVQPLGLLVAGAGVAAAVVASVPFVRYPAVVPVALLGAAPFRVPVAVGDEDAFLLVPFYFVLTAAVLALAYRVARGDRPTPPSPFIALPLAAFVAFTAVSFLWTWDQREGAIALAFFAFPFTAAFAVVARAPFAPWLPRALLATVVALGSLFAAIGVWQAQTQTVFFARDIEVANAYTSFYRVTSLFKDPSLYGRYLVVPIVALLVVIVVRRSRTAEWGVAAALVAFLFWGLYYSYSQSSFVALFVVTFAIALLGAGRRLRVVLLVWAAAAALATAGYAAHAIEGRSAQEATSGRSRLVTLTLDAFWARPVAGVGIGGQPQASADLSGRRSASRNASHTTPLTVLAEGGVIALALYVWLLAAAGWTLLLVARRDWVLGIVLAAVLLALFVHSLLYAGFFEEPVTWGIFGVAAAILAAVPATSSAAPKERPDAAPAAPRLAQ